MIRKATAADITAIADIYEKIHKQESAGQVTIGWLPGVYPVEETAALAVEREDMFVYEDAGRIVAAAIINQIQVDSYAAGRWEYQAEDADVCVLHTLVVDPDQSARGYGRHFVAFYEDYARKIGCHYLRMDTNAINVRARHMYAKLGYKEVDIVPCIFNGIPDVQLVLLEKSL